MTAYATYTPRGVTLFRSRRTAEREGLGPVAEVNPSKYVREGTLDTRARVHFSARDQSYPLLVAAIENAE